MLIVLLTLALAQFVAWPLLLWASAKVVRVPGVGIARAYAAFGLLLLVSLSEFSIFALVDLPLPILIAMACSSIAVCVWLVKAMFRTGWLRALGCLALTIAANVALAFGIRAVAVEAFIIPGGSMAPTLLNGERLLADKVTLRFRRPRRGEVVVFHPPHSPETNYVKRVIGIEGDRLELSGDDLLVNGAPAGKSSMRNYRPWGDMQPVEFPAVVPPGKLFMLGDKRDASLDSRHWGFADVRQVVGLAVVIYASVTPPEMSGRFLDNPSGAAERPNQIRWERIGKAVN